MLHTRKACYNKPIRILVRMVQIIWLVEQDWSCQKRQTTNLELTICTSYKLIGRSAGRIWHFPLKFQVSKMETKRHVQWNPAESKLIIIKTRKFFHMTIRKQTVQGLCFMNELQPNLQEHRDCSGWQRRKTRLLWLMRHPFRCVEVHSTHRKVC